MRSDGDIRPAQGDSNFQQLCKVNWNVVFQLGGSKRYFCKMMSGLPAIKWKMNLCNYLEIKVHPPLQKLFRILMLRSLCTAVDQSYPGFGCHLSRVAFLLLFGEAKRREIKKNVIMKFQSRPDFWKNIEGSFYSLFSTS